MAVLKHGLNREGYKPKSLKEIKDSIETKLEKYNPGFDFSPESPDGQLIGIMANELSLVWKQMGRIYRSYDPAQCTGQALRNIGLITGSQYGVATRSQADITVTGVAGTIIPKNSVVQDQDGNQFFTSIDAEIPSVVTVVSKLSGPLPIAKGAITVIGTPVTGWAACANLLPGRTGSAPETEENYRNRRDATVMRRTRSVVEAMEGELLDANAEQVLIINNDSIYTLPDGTPPKSIHVTIGGGTALDETIAKTIYNSKGLGVVTHGATAVTVTDDGGIDHVIKFTRATAVIIEINLTFKFLADSYSGAEAAIRTSLIEAINNLTAGQDVIWSRLFQEITKHGEAEIETLTIGRQGGTQASANISIAGGEYATLSDLDIVLINNT